MCGYFPAAISLGLWWVGTFLLMRKVRRDFKSTEIDGSVYVQVRGSVFLWKGDVALPVSKRDRYPEANTVYFQDFSVEEMRAFLLAKDRFFYRLLFRFLKYHVAMSMSVFFLTYLPICVLWNCEFSFFLLGFLLVIDFGLFVFHGLILHSSLDFAVPFRRMPSEQEKKDMKKICRGLTITIWNTLLLSIPRNRFDSCFDKLVSYMKDKEIM